MNCVRFTVFSDLHHHPAWFKSDAGQRLDSILQRAADDRSEFVIHLGDFCHQISQGADLIQKYNQFSLPTFHTLGNHEFDLNTLEEILQAYKMPGNYYFFDCNNFRFIVLDGNYFSDFAGIYFHYSERNYFDHPAGRDWLDPEQVEWFRDTVLTSPCPCIVCSHAALEYESGGIKNHAAMQEIIRQSQSTPGRVMMCLNGHYHRDNLSIRERTAYFHVNSATFDWIDRPHYFYPQEWYSEFECVGNQIIYEKPLCATVTIDHNGVIEIKGTPGNFVGSITREMTGNEPVRYPCTPSIMDRKVQI